MSCFHQTVSITAGRCLKDYTFIVTVRLCSVGCTDCWEAQQREVIGQFFLSFFLIPTSINLWTFAPRVRATLRHNNSGSIRVTWCFSCINISSLRHLISFSIIYSLVVGNSVLTKMSISALLCLSVCTFLSFLFHTFTWKRSHFNHILASLFLKRERDVCVLLSVSHILHLIFLIIHCMKDKRGACLFASACIGCLFTCLFFFYIHVRLCFHPPCYQKFRL